MRVQQSLASFAYLSQFAPEGTTIDLAMEGRIPPEVIFESGGTILLDVDMWQEIRDQWVASMGKTPAEMKTQYDMVEGPRKVAIAWLLDEIPEGVALVDGERVSILREDAQIVSTEDYFK